MPPKSGHHAVSWKSEDRRRGATDPCQGSAATRKIAAVAVKWPPEIPAEDTAGFEADGVESLHAGAISGGPTNVKVALRWDCFSGPPVNRGPLDREDAGDRALPPSGLQKTSHRCTPTIGWVGTSKPDTR